MKKIGIHFNGIKYFGSNLFLIVIITLIHLVIFSLILFGISGLIHQNPWELSDLLTEKLSTRLYIGLSIYVVLSFLYFFLKNKDFRQDSNRGKYFKTITVKNGRKSIPIKVDKIKWISSDGPYLHIHTPDKNHIELDSLKHIITTLPEKFKRVHRSTIVNTDMIKELKSRGNGDYDVIMNAGEILRLSRNYRKELKGLLP